MDPPQGRPGGTKGEAALKAGILIITAALAVFGGAACAHTEAEERLAALIAIMQADLARPATPGIKARLLESASLLPLMLREAHAPSPEVEAARRLHARLRGAGAHHRTAAQATITRLAGHHPFRPPPSPEDIPRAMALGAAIHRSTCAGCHDHPQPHAFLPAEDLYQLACREPETAFAARLYLGVKGQPDTGFRNPFSPDERAALALWYRKARPCGPAP